MTPATDLPGQAAQRPAGPSRVAGRGAAAMTAWAAGLLGAACVAWSGMPLPRTGLAHFALVLAIGCAALGAVRLALARVPPPEGIFVSWPLRIWAGFLELTRFIPWEEGAVLAVLWLEVLHPARPWHTAGLGAALLAYLLAVHVSESRASPRVLRPQAPLLAAGACLLAAGAGAAMIPAAGAGGGPGWLRVLASAAAVGAAALAVPLARPGSR
jgi:hypothetical protein